MSKVCTLIVAGGEGRRIGGHKADIELCGIRLIDHVLSRAADWELPTYVQVRHRKQVQTPGYVQILDKPEIEGPLSGIIAGLHFARTEGFSHVLSVSCDMPFLPRDLVDWLLPAAKQNHKVTMACSGGVLHPICAIWPVKCLQSLESSAACGVLSLRGAAKAYGRDELDWPDKPFDPFFNINEGADLARAHEIIEAMQA